VDSAAHQDNKTTARYNYVRSVEEAFENDVVNQRPKGIVSLRINFTPEELERMQRDADELSEFIEAIKQVPVNSDMLEPA
jgi:hypothetical protein